LLTAGNLVRMVLFQALWLLLGAVLPPSGSSATELVLGLAVVAAALLIVAAAAGVSLPVFRAFFSAGRRRFETVVTPRLSDPDAAGRPRPRAPSVCPAAG
jgi:hypothetical protein